MCIHNLFAFFEIDRRSEACSTFKGNHSKWLFLDNFDPAIRPQ